MEAYQDQNGHPIKIGDALIYDEGEGYGRGIHEVVELNGEMAGVTRIGYPEWTVISSDRPIPLRFYKVFADSPENRTYHARLADVDVDKAFTPEYAARVFTG